MDLDLQDTGYLLLKNIWGGIMGFFAGGWLVTQFQQGAGGGPFVSGRAARPGR